MKIKNYFLQILLFTICLTISACDSSGTDDEIAINGTWESTSPNRGILFIDLPDVESYDLNDTENCYNLSFRSTLSRLSEDNFEILNDGEVTDTVSIRVRNNMLIINEGETFELTFEESDQDGNSLEICDF
jgi:hypothetical protein